MSDKLITLADQAATDELQRALFAALRESCDGVIDRYLDGTPAPQVTTRATGPLPAVYDDDTGKLLVPFDPLTLVIDRRCESFHGAVVHVELAPDVAAQAVFVPAEVDGKPVPPKVVDGKVEQPIVLTLPDGKGGTVQAEGKTVDGVPLKKYAIDLSACVPPLDNPAGTGGIGAAGMVASGAVGGGILGAIALGTLGTNAALIGGALGALVGGAVAFMSTRQAIPLSAVAALVQEDKDP